MCGISCEVWASARTRTRDRRGPALAVTVTRKGGNVWAKSVFELLYVGDWVLSHDDEAYIMYTGCVVCICGIMGERCEWQTV